MKADHEAETPYVGRDRKRTQSSRSAADGYVRVDASDAEALARCEAAVLIGKTLAADPELRWAYDEAARIAAGGPRRARAARVRAALANPVLAWSTAAVSTIVAIVSLMTSPHQSSSEATASGDAEAVVRSGADAPAPSGDSATPRPVTLDSAPAGIPSSAPTLTAPVASTAGHSAPRSNAGSDPAFTSSVVVLPGRVFVDARSVAVMPFGVEAANSPTQPSPRVRAVASDLYADVVRRLESISGIYVAQPISVMPYANTDLGTEEIASQLGVRGIIEGRVAAAAGRVRVTLSLTDAASDDVMWQGTVERPADAVAGIGVDMAADVAAALANAGAPTSGATNYREDPF